MASSETSAYGMNVLALAYHDVSPRAAPEASGFAGPAAARYKLTPEQFVAHLDAIASEGLRPGTVECRAPEPRLVLTFDDGGRSATTTIAPELARRGWRAYFFVPTAQIGEAGFVDADAIRALHEDGHVVGSHGHSHRPLTALSEADLEHELRASRASLENILGAPVDSLAVPGGFYSPRVALAAATAGYRHVLTSEPWLAPRAEGGATVYGRFAVVTSTPAHEVAALCRLSPGLLLRRRLGWTIRKSARSALGSLYARAREAELSRRARARA